MCSYVTVYVTFVNRKRVPAKNFRLLSIQSVTFKHLPLSISDDASVLRNSKGRTLELFAREPSLKNTTANERANYII